MKVLVTGANGFLGQHLCLQLSIQGYKIIAAGRGPSRLQSNVAISYAEVDLTNRSAVSNLLTNHNPDVIIHAAAMSKPDECAQNIELCLLNNVEATSFLLQNFNGHFIYISTDFVFGEDGPHSEDGLPSPLNFYGESKLLAEQVVRKALQTFSIVRPVFIYGKMYNGMRPSFLHWIKANLEARKAIKVVSDQLRTPTFVDDICKGIISIIEKKAYGDFHLAGKDILSPYLMALITAEVLQLDDSLIKEVNSETFPEPVKRAKRSGLKIEKAIKELDYNPVSFIEGVQLTFKD